MALKKIRWLMKTQADQQSTAWNLRRRQTKPNPINPIIAAVPIAPTGRDGSGTATEVVRVILPTAPLSMTIVIKLLRSNVGLKRTPLVVVLDVPFGPAADAEFEKEPPEVKVLARVATTPAPDENATREVNCIKSLILPGRK